MSTARHSGKFRILIVDDEASIRMIVSEVLTEEGYHVEVAEDGVAALTRIQRGDIQLVISDIRMPHMSGIELLSKIKEFDREIQVIIMTSHASIDTAIQAIRLGAYDYLTKPFEELEVISTVVARTVSKLELELQVKSLLEKLTLQNEEIERLYTHTTRLFQTLDAEEVADSALRALQSLAGGSTSIVQYRYSAQAGTLVPGKIILDESMPVDMQPRLAPVKVRPDELKSTHPGHEDVVAGLTWKNPADQSAVYPVKIGGELWGAFAAVRTGAPLANSSRRMMRQYVENVAAQMGKAELYAHIESMATLDGLTQIPNRRHFEKFLAVEMERARRFGNALTLVLFDIDSFKHYNDTNGHLAGDAVLRDLSQLVQHSTRSVDMLARYGGEEFVSVHVETGAEGAAARAEQIRAAIEAHDFPEGDKQPLGRLTVSGGYATFPECGQTPEQLIAAADKALYEAKNSGRNRMIAADAIREPAASPTS